VEFELVTDRPVLNFVPTVAARGSVDEEKLRTPQDLLDWVAQAGLVDVPPPVDAAGLERARVLREAMFQLVAALIDQRPADPGDRQAVNAAAAVAPPVLRLDDDGLHRTGDLDAVLALIARDCLDLHAGPDRAALRWCDDPTCTRPFVDRSRGQRRRWCGMRGCGDRAKAAAYRQRHRAGSATGMSSDRPQLTERPL
jgi:predicted RNA-binding Zn ribbon-like protein